MEAPNLYAHGGPGTHNGPETAPVAGAALALVGAAGVCIWDLHWFCKGEVGEVIIGPSLVSGCILAG